MLNSHLRITIEIPTGEDKPTPKKSEAPEKESLEKKSEEKYSDGCPFGEDCPMKKKCDCPDGDKAKGLAGETEKDEEDESAS